MMIDNLPFIFSAILYVAMMVYGMASLASYWSFIHLRAERAQEIPDLLFALLGLGLPMAGWVGCFVTPWAFFILPVSLGLLYGVTERTERRADKELDSMRQQDLDFAENMILEDSSNAAAHWARAQACERQGDLGEALRSYRRASALCGKTLPVEELAEIEARLTAAMADSEAGGTLKEPSRLGRPRRLGMTWILMGFGLLIAFWNWAWAVNVVSLMAFLRWLHGRKDRRSD